MLFNAVQKYHRALPTSDGELITNEIVYLVPVCNAIVFVPTETASAPMQTDEVPVVVYIYLSFSQACNAILSLVIHKFLPSPISLTSYNLAILHVS